MTEGERKAVKALAWMCERYLGPGNATSLKHQFMSAGEMAIELLAEHGLVIRTSSGGSWTGEGRAFLELD